MKQLVINADDFGLCHSINQAIVYAHEQGIVTSTTLMVGMPGAEEAYELARQHPGLGVGVHLSLTAGRPLAADVPSLTGPDGRFCKLPQLLEQARPDEVAREIEAQVQALLAQGLRPTHLDSHHHVHRYLPAAAEAMQGLARTLGVPVRQFGPTFSDAFYGREAVTVEGLVSIVAGLPASGMCEIMTHPGYDAPDLQQLSSYTQERALELAVLTDPAAARAIAAAGTVLVNYRGEQRRALHG